MAMRIALVDDCQLTRQGLCALLHGISEWQVVLETGDGYDALTRIKQQPVDLAILEVAMPGLNGIMTTRYIRRDSPKTQVLALSRHSDQRFVRGMFDAGAAAFVLKTCDFEELCLAIQTVLQGQRYCSKQLSPLSAAVVDQPGPDAPPTGARLTDREQQVLQLVAEGMSTRQVASQLQVSVKTIDTHRQHIMEKLHIHSLAKLTRYALREGMTFLD